jgi:hypothetical protein
VTAQQSDGDGRNHTHGRWLRAELVDGIAEAVALPLDAASRAAAITGLVQEIYEDLAWVNAASAHSRELDSFARVLAETHHHKNRMSALARVPTATEANIIITTAQNLRTIDQLDEEVSSYDDLSVSTDSAGRLVLDCPTCGFLPIPLRETTLSDLTNAAMDHLSEQHPYSLTLPSARSRVTNKPTPTPTPTPAPMPTPVNGEGGAPVGYFTDRFWSLIALLSEEGAGLEGLVRELASSSKKEILTFHEQLTNAITLLDTPAHRDQQVHNLDKPLETVPSAMSDAVFVKVRLAVVASGRDVWLDVLANPDHLTGGWSLQSGQALLNAPTAALTRSTPTPLRPARQDRHRVRELVTDAS